MNNKSLEKLYNQYSNEVYLYAFSLCKNHHDAQELVSETFLKVLLSLNQEDGDFNMCVFHTFYSTIYYLTIDI